MGERLDQEDRRQLSGAQLSVSSKEFDEQLLLGQIALVALQAAGASPQDKTNITGSSNVRQALTSGAVDLYWEYTGTAWISYLKQTKPIADPQAQYDAVKQADAAEQRHLVGPLAGQRHLRPRGNAERRSPRPASRRSRTTPTW